jgi:hypothetical protein
VVTGEMAGTVTVTIGENILCNSFSPKRHIMGEEEFGEIQRCKIP